MDQKKIDELMKKSTEELVGIIINLDNKLIYLIKEISKDEAYKGIILDKNLNDFFAMKYEEEN